MTFWVELARKLSLCYVYGENQPIYHIAQKQTYSLSPHTKVSQGEEEWNVNSI